MDYPQTVTTVLASTSASGAGTDTAGTVVLGFLFVLVVLALLAAVTALIGAFFTRQAAREATRAARSAGEAAEKAAAAGTAASAPGAGAAAAPEPEAEPPVAENPRLLAVVAAAVHTVFGERPHRIVSVRQSRTGWAQEGRRQIFSSHRVR